MENINTSDIPKIIITAGDESGVGPEVILKALSSNKIPHGVEFIIIGSKHNFYKTYEKLQLINNKNITNPDNLNIIDINFSKADKEESREVFGNASFHHLATAIDIVKSLPNAALVTAPICKKSWALAGHNFSGQTELLAKKCNVSNVGMLFTAKSPFTGWRFNTLLATTHIPIKQISGSLSEKLISSKLNLLYNFSKQFNPKPKLYIAGLNRHAGEEGILGSEEKDFINSTLKNLNSKYKEANISGPLSPDSCWISSAKAWKEKKVPTHDGILAMYHDQGLIPVKIIASNYSVNTTLGLPIIRTSPDHGTGFDIAGKGIAQSQSMLEAIKTASDLLKLKIS